MKNIIFWILFFLGAITMLSSCMTLDKALTKVASAPTLNDSQDKLLSTLCTVKYPPKEYTSPGTTNIDSVEYKQTIASMQEKLDLYKRDYNNIVKMLKDGDNADLTKVLNEVKQRADSLSIALNIAKQGKIPCPKIIKTDTTHTVNVAELNACQIDNKNLKIDNAKKDVQIASLTEQVKKLEQKPDRYWKGIKLGSIVTAIVLIIIGAGLFLKLKSII